jgi:hypothetical protein
MPPDFLAYVKTNYSGEVVFSDPMWHAVRLWRAAMRSLADREADGPMADHAAIGAEITRAARDLPDGYSIHVCAERGAAWVELHDPAGDHIPAEALADLPLSAEIGMSINEAIAASQFDATTQETK